MGSDFWAVWGGAFATYLVLLAVRLLVRNHRRVLLGAEERQEAALEAREREADAALNAAELEALEPPGPVALGARAADALEQEFAVLEGRVDHRERMAEHALVEKNKAEARALLAAESAERERLRRQKYCRHPRHRHEVRPEAPTCGSCGLDLTHTDTTNPLDPYGEEELPF